MVLLAIMHGLKIWLSLSKDRKLWKYVIGSIPKLVPIPKSKAITDVNVSETTIIEDDYEACLEEW